MALGPRELGETRDLAGFSRPEVAVGDEQDAIGDRPQTTEIIERVLVDYPVPVVMGEDRQPFLGRHGFPLPFSRRR